MAIKIKILNFIFILISLSFTLKLYAQGDFASPADMVKLKEKKQAPVKAKIKSKDVGQVGIVKVDGSAVYEFANFDSPVLEYMDRGKKVKMSKKLYPGIGGLGAFYKIRIKKGNYGFIADTDVEKTGKKSLDKDDDLDENDKLEEDKLIKSSDPAELQTGMFGEDEESEAKFDTVYLSRYVGLLYGSYNYAEMLRNKTEAAQTNLLGAKLTGPLGIMGGMPLDVNMLFTTSAPSFYSKIASSSSGFMLLGDILVSLPIYESKRVLLFYGLGAVIRYSSWKVKLKSQAGKAPVDSQEVGMGLAATGGAAISLGARMALRGDFRYYYEKEKYFGYGLALQFKY